MSDNPMADKLERFYELAKAALLTLEPAVANGAYLTLVMHTPGFPERELVITRAPDIQPIIEALQRCAARPDESPDRP